MTKFELDYRKFEHKTQRNQIFNRFQFTIESVFESLKISDLDIITPYSSNMIDPIVKKL